MSKIQALQMRLDQEVLLNQITVRIHRSLELQKILATATAEIRAFLNTDRVIIYRFYSEVAGKIIAEDIEPERLPSLLEQHFTLEQIAPFSCKAFLKTRQGLVIDVANQQIGFSSGANSTANPLLKLEVASYAVHPGHLQNLQALGVQSALIVPLVFSETPTEGKIWGLLISQHATPRPTSAAEVNFVQRN